MKKIDTNNLPAAIAPRGRIMIRVLLLKSNTMKKAAYWFDGVIENVQESKHWSTTFITLLLILTLGAGSLYMLLNSPA